MNEIGKDIYPVPGKGNASPKGWNHDHAIFADILRWYDSPTIIEVGTWLGASAIHMGNIIKTGKIYCVDTWLGSLEFWTTHRQTPERDLMLKHGYPQVYYQFIRNVQAAKLEHLITPVPMPSLQAAQYFKETELKADVIYIDASHDQDDVKRDILAYLPLLKPGGIIFGDDYTSFAGVAIAVKEVFGLSANIIDDNFWMYGV
jgi:hypothetical protein